MRRCCFTTHWVWRSPCSSCSYVTLGLQSYKTKSIAVAFTNRQIPQFPKMLSMERIPDQLGYLVLTEDGAVLTSGGELENDERIANIVAGLVTLTDKIDPKAFRPNEVFDKISITYSDHCYIICLSNKKIHVLKKRLRALPDSHINERQSLLDV